MTAAPILAHTTPATTVTLEEWIKAQAYALGFDLAGMTRLGPADSSEPFDRWLVAEYAGEMSYMHRTAEKRRDSRLPVADATSAIVVALNYGGTSPKGPVARYARGTDYHDVMLAKLNDLHHRIEERIGRRISGRPYVDTGPLLERDLARRAGLGWFGKNTNLINPRIGSYFFIGSLLLDLDLESDTPFEEDRCGTCARCLDACPTDAFVEPRVLDATRCVSYLTIELRGSIPEEMREMIGDRMYGCDVCQEVCPWNVRFASDLTEQALAPREAIAASDTRTLAREILAMDEDRFRRDFKGSPMKRAKLRGLKRNAAVVLGNVGETEDVNALSEAFDDPDPLVREHAGWAVKRIR